MKNKIYFDTGYWYIEAGDGLTVYRAADSTGLPPESGWSVISGTPPAPTLVQGSCELLSSQSSASSPSSVSSPSSQSSTSDVSSGSSLSSASSSLSSGGGVTGYTVSGAETSGVNGLYCPAGVYGSYSNKTYYKKDGEEWYIFFTDNETDGCSSSAYWWLSNGLGYSYGCGESYFFQGSTADTPPLTGWTANMGAGVITLAETSCGGDESSASSASSPSSASSVSSPSSASSISSTSSLSSQSSVSSTSDVSSASSASSDSSAGAVVDGYLVSGAGTSGANGQYCANGTYGGETLYVKEGGGWYLYYYGDNSWNIHTEANVSEFPHYYQDYPATNDPTNPWTQADGQSPAPTVSYSACSAPETSSASSASSASSTSDVSSASSASSGGGEPGYLVSGAGAEVANGVYYEDGTYNGQPLYTKDGGGCYIFYYGWNSYNIYTDFTSAFYYQPSPETIDPTNAWDIAMGPGPAPTVTAV